MFRGIRQFVIPVRDQNFAIMALMVVAGMAFFLLGFAGFTAFAAWLIWLLWNFVAPQLSFIPVEYARLNFLLVWGLIVLVVILRGLIKGK